MSGLPPPPPPPPPSAPTSSDNPNNAYSNDPQYDEFSQGYGLTDNLLYPSHSNLVENQPQLGQESNPNSFQQFDPNHNSVPTQDFQSIPEYNAQPNPTEWMNGNSQDQEEAFYPNQHDLQQQQPPVDLNYLPPELVEEQHYHQFDSFQYDQDQEQDETQVATGSTKKSRPIKYQTLPPDHPSHEFWRGKNHPLEPEDLGLAEGEEEEPNYFTK